MIAAVSAARAGARVALIEAHSYPGGMANQALVQPYQTFHSPRGQVIRGLPQEYVDRLAALRGTLGHVRDPIGFAASVTPVDDAVSRAVMESWLLEEGVDVLLGTAVTGIVEDGGRIRSVNAIKVNPEAFPAGIPFGHWENEMPLAGEAVELACDAVVDATGSARVRRFVGLPCEISDDRQPMSWLFAMRGVDKGALLDYVYAHPDDFVLSDDPRCREERYIGVSGFFSLVREAKEKGVWEVPRDRLLFFETPRAGEVIVNTTRIPHGFGSDAEIISEGKRQIEFLARFMRARVPGFASAEISRVADRIGVRESFRSQCAYMLTRDDVVGGARFADVIALGAFPIDIHSARDEDLHAEKVGARGQYDIPLSCIVCDEFPNLVMAGRIISVTHGAFASTRVMPTSMAVGQAAGIAAAVIAEERGAHSAEDARTGTADSAVGAERGKTAHAGGASAHCAEVSGIHSALSSRLYPRVKELLLAGGAVLSDGQVYWGK